LKAGLIPGILHAEIPEDVIQKEEFIKIVFVCDKTRR
jgi:hypothetical protein